MSAQQQAQSAEQQSVKPPTKVQAERKKKKEEREATLKEGHKTKLKWNWQFSWAKEILRLAIANGDITEKHSYNEIHMWHPEIEATERSKLPGRIRGLREQVKEDAEAAKSDSIDLAHDRKLYPIPTHNYRGEERWEGSLAQRTLKQQIAEEVHKSMQPAEFASQDVFKNYPEDIIRQHIYLEIKFQKYCLYRNEKKKSKEVRFS